MLLLLLLFTLFVLVLLGFYVFVAAPRSRAHQTFAAFIICLALWTVKDIVFWEFQAARGGNPAWWASASFILSLLLQYSLVVFAWVFPENRRTPRRKAAVLFAPGLVLAPAAAFGLLWQRVEFAGDRLQIDFAPLAYAFVIYVYAIFAYGAAILWLKYRRYRNTQRGQQLGAILWALGITAILKTAANIVLPFFGNYNLLPISATFVIPGVLIYAYAITNFKLFSFSTALDQFRLFPIIYKIALTIAVVAVASFAIFQIPIVWWAFQDGVSEEAWRRYLTFSVITALVPNLLLLLLIVRTISRPLRRITEAAVEVAGGNYGATVEQDSNDEIGLLAESFNEMSRKMAADIEQLKKLNEQLMRTEKLAAMGTLAAGVAHEINNPLASISSLVQMLQSNSAALDDETREMLRLVQTQIARITGVTRDMLDFARPRPAARKAVDVNEILEASLRLASFDKEFQRLKLKKNFQSFLPKISADADRLQQVFLNLLLNARDAMSASGGEIEITTCHNSDEVVIEIADTGSGISPGLAKQIFDPFFTTKTAGKGTGLGLAVCYGIVTAHGGKIEAQPNNGRGARFIVSLPINAEIVNEELRMEN
jgi:signal transduction histidine kinase